MHRLHVRQPGPSSATSPPPSAFDVHEVVSLPGTDATEIPTSSPRTTGHLPLDVGEWPDPRLARHQHATIAGMRKKSVSLPMDQRRASQRETASMAAYHQ